MTIPDILLRVGEIRTGGEGPNASRQAFWGVAPTGEPHLGYLPTLLASRILQEDGWSTTLFIGDYHGYLDDEKTQWSDLNGRANCYSRVLASSFGRTLSAQIEYRTPEYIDGLLKFSRHLTVEKALRLGDGTLRRDISQRQTSDILYVLMQMYDIVHFDVGLGICGQDESPIYRGWETVPGASREKAIYFLYIPMCPGVQLPEMHASSPAGNRISIDADAQEVLDGLQRHVAHTDTSATDSPLVRYCANVLVPLLQGLTGEARWLPEQTDASYLARLADAVADAIAICQQ